MGVLIVALCVFACVCVCVSGMTKVEEKLKAGRAKKPEGSGFSEEPQRRPTPSQSTKKDPATTSSGENLCQGFKWISLSIEMFEIMLLLFFYCLYKTQIFHSSEA